MPRRMATGRTLWQVIHFTPDVGKPKVLSANPYSPITITFRRVLYSLFLMEQSTAGKGLKPQTPLTNDPRPEVEGYPGGKGRSTMPLLPG